MLEFIRRQSTSFMSWLILGGIALIFGLQFGLPSDSLTLGADAIAKVHGEEIRDEDFKFQYGMAARFGMVPKDAKQREQQGTNEQLIDGMVERLLLVHEAEAIGLAATVEQAEDVVIDGHVIFSGIKLDRLDPKDKFNNDLFQANWIKPLGGSEPKFLRHQSEEILAQSLRDLISASVLVPESEVRRQYEKGANRLTLRFARYDFSKFADLADPTSEQLDSYIAEHTEELEKRYESQQSMFTGLPKQARLWVIQAATTDETRTALQTARTEITEGKTRFSDVARTKSSHDTAGRGGDYGWVDEQSTTASDLPEAVRAAIPGLTDGAVSELVEADGSLWMLQVSARREGDVPKEDALRELAEPAVRDQLAKDMARRAAEEDQNAVTAGNPIAEVFATDGAMGETTFFGGSNIEDLPTDPAGDEGQPAEGQDQPQPQPAEGEGDSQPAEGAAAPSAPASSDPLAGRQRPKMEMQTSPPLTRDQQFVPDLGSVPDLIDAAWASTGEAELLDGIYEVSGAIVLAGVEKRDEATDEGFAEQRKLLEGFMRQRKAAQLVSGWSQRRCFDAKASGDIKVSEAIIKRYTTYDSKAEDGKDAKEEGKAEEPPAPEGHVVCQRVGMLAGRR